MSPECKREGYTVDVSGSKLLETARLALEGNPLFQLLPEEVQLTIKANVQTKIIKDHFNHLYAMPETATYFFQEVTGVAIDEMTNFCSSMIGMIAGGPKK